VVVELRESDASVIRASAVPVEDWSAMRGRLLAARDDLAALRAHAEAGVTRATDLHPQHHWLWQAEVALTRLLEQDGDLASLAVLAASRSQRAEQEDRL
jgi:hypothetical protein